MNPLPDHSTTQSPSYLDFYANRRVLITGGWVLWGPTSRAGWWTWAALAA